MKRIILVGWVTLAVTVGGVGVSVGENCEKVADGVVERANELFGLGRWEEEKKIVTEAMGKCPGEERLWAARGAVLFAEKKFEEALSDFVVAKKKMMESGVMRQGMLILSGGAFMCYVMLGRCEEAIEENEYRDSLIGRKGSDFTGNLRKDGCESARREIERVHEKEWK
jgi:tetratricopeptide (TPR) repeat protein